MNDSTQNMLWYQSEINLQWFDATPATVNIILLLLGKLRSNNIINMLLL